MPDMTASQLLAQQLCTAQCLLAASPPDTCDCCGGQWHGALAQVRVPETAAYRRPAAAPQPGPPLIDRSGAVVDLDDAHRELDELDELEAAR